MMNVTFLAVNSQYIHMALAPWCLKAACGDAFPTTVVEASINEPVRDVLHAVCETAPDVLCVGAYIWNVEYVLALCADLRLIAPACRIVLGGPEATYRAVELLQKWPQVDAIICGEGEQVLPKLLARWQSATLGDFSDLAAVAYRGADGRIHSNTQVALVEELASLPSPYTDEMCRQAKGRVVYYESSRGCPFHCSYCLSSATEGVRYFPLDRVGRELRKLAQAEPKVIKLCDRTFNADRRRSLAVLDLILSETGNVPVHLEVGADLFDDIWLDRLSQAPPGKILIEAGIQSFSRRTLAQVSRSCDLEKLERNLRQILATGNVRIHADLICALPSETYQGFAASFDRLHDIGPHEIQVGFLKLLYGSRLREQAQEYGYRVSSRPPYQVYASSDISAQELLVLEEFEDVVEKFYNSGRFTAALTYLGRFYPSAFELFDALRGFVADKGLRFARLSAAALYGLLCDFSRILPGLDEARFQTFLRFDYFSSGLKGGVPDCIRREEPVGFRDACFAFLQDEQMRDKLLPDLRGLSAKEAYKRVRFVEFSHDPMCADAPPGETILLFDPIQKSAVSRRLIPLRISNFPKYNCKPFPSLQ